MKRNTPFTSLKILELFLRNSKNITEKKQEFKNPNSQKEIMF